MSDFIIAIHGGAENKNHDEIGPEKDAAYRKGLENALQAGWEILNDGGAALDAVEAAVRSLENCYLFNAGKGGAFETEWLKPAGVKGIPHAFVVKDGKVVLASHPMQLSAELIEGLLAGGEAEAKALESLAAARKRQEALGEAMKAFREAGAKKDIAAMEKAFDSLKEMESARNYLPSLKVELLIAKADWSGVEANLKELSGEPVGRMLVTQVASRATRDEALPEAFRKTMAAELGKSVEEKGQPHEFQILARLQWQLGDKEAALAAAKKGAAAAEAARQANEKFPAAPYQRFTESLEKGELPTNEQMGDWMREAMKPAAPAAEAAKG